MTENRSRFPELKGIRETVFTDLNDFALSNDRERKYEAPNPRLSIPVRRLRFQARMNELVRKKHFTILEKSCEFAGIDEIWVFKDPHSDRVVTYKLRYSSNVSGKWYVKVSSANGDNTERGYQTVHIPQKDLRKARKSILLVSEFIPGAVRMQIGQVGDIWYVVDSETHFEVEIVLYKVGRDEPDATSPIKLLVEIAPYDCPSLDVAVKLMKKYERLLKLTKRIRGSNSELFREKN